MGGTLENNTPVKLRSQVCFSQSAESLSDARRLLVHILHTVSPGTTVAADVRIWLLGQIFESEETRVLIAINRRKKKKTLSPDVCVYVYVCVSNTFQFAELAGKMVSMSGIRRSSSGSHRRVSSDRCLAYIFYELISIRRGIYEMGSH